MEKRKSSAPKAEEERQCPKGRGKRKKLKRVGTVWEKEGHVREKDFYEHKSERRRKTIARVLTNLKNGPGVG